MNSLEFVVDYLIKHEAHYTGGMFWIDGSSNESITAGLQSIAEVSCIVLYCLRMELVFRQSDSMTIFAKCRVDSSLTCPCLTRHDTYDRPSILEIDL